HNELDNFDPCKFTVNGVEYYSAENYFQCQKATTPEDHERVRQAGSGVAVWSAGLRVNPLRSDWESIKVEQMYIGNKAKFEQNPRWANILCESVGRITFRASTSFWNGWNGLLLERIRAELRHNGIEDDKTVMRVKKMMEQYANDHREIETNMVTLPRNSFIKWFADKTSSS
ncbi:unnamed protein product, partial [Didymodactylos carnosus]